MVMANRRAANPFIFVGCWELREMLGRSARDERQLLEAIEEAPLDSLYYHTHSFLLRHKYIAGPYPNDFATWAAIQVRDRVLGEKLGILNPYDFGDLESMRAEIVTIIADHLSRLQVIPGVIYEEPFQFMQSRIIPAPTGLQAHTLREFRKVLGSVEASVIYYHTFEAILRLGKPKGDFAIWVEEQLGLPELGKRISNLHPYRISLESIRGRILKLCDEFLKEGGEQK
ncbi:MAG: hypothetical protein AMJ94_03435 [Deltaproteobacteria bacterium SM23_61]|nr:MAG: hypothetical protein AMJ94_03435 [Deltaproteobacteria bacterium SM23_61]